MNKIAILILNFNKPKLTLECYQSLIQNNYQKADVYILDNGSSDECLDQITPYIHYKHIHHTKDNYGFSGGFNRGIEFIRDQNIYDSVLFLTNDTVVDKNILNDINSFNLHANCDLIAPRIHNYRKSTQIDSFGGFYNPDTFSLTHYQTENLPSMMKEYDYIPGTAFWFTLESFQKLNGMDESYHTYWEDVDFSFRAYQNNLRMGRLNKAAIYHKIGKTTHKKSIYTLYYFQRNRIQFIKNHFNETYQKQAKMIIQKDLEILKEKYQSHDPVRLKYIEEIDQLLLDL